MKGSSGISSGNFCGGNEITRGKPIWQLASENNKKPRRVSKRFVTKVRQVPLT